MNLEATDSIVKKLLNYEELRSWIYYKNIIAAARTKSYSLL